MKKNTNHQNINEINILDDIEYISKSTHIIAEALRRAAEVAQLVNGDIVITEFKIISNCYSWSPKIKNMVKVSSYI